MLVFSLIVKNGYDTQFWYTTWMGFENLKAKYPRLYELEKKKYCKVADRVTQGGITGKWKSNPIVAGLSNNLDAFIMHNAPISLLPGTDQISCVILDDGNYRVSELRKLIESKQPL